jgi:hypothetical protein
MENSIGKTGNEEGRRDLVTHIHIVRSSADFEVGIEEAVAALGTDEEENHTRLLSF